MRLYETAFLIAPNLSEEENEQIIQQMSEVVTQKKGKMVDVDKWGKRKLAYQIQKFENAFYVFFLYEGSPDIPSELERRFKQDEKIIRYLTVKRDEKEGLKRKKTAAKTEKKADFPKEEVGQDVMEEKEEEKAEVKAEKKEAKKEDGIEAKTGKKKEGKEGAKKEAKKEEQIEEKEAEKEKVKDEAGREEKKASALKKAKSDETVKEEE